MIVNRQPLYKFLKYKFLVCLIVAVSLIVLQFYIIVNAATLTSKYYDYYYCIRDINDRIISCYSIYDISFSLYYKTQLLHLFNLISVVATLIMYVIISACLHRENLTFNMSLQLVTISITVAYILAILANMWHIVDIRYITNEEIIVWNAIDTEFINQYDVVNIFIITHICNMLLVCL